MRSVIETLEGAQDRPDWSVSGSAMRWVPPAGRVQPHQAKREIAVMEIQADFSGFVASLRHLGEELTRFFAQVERKRDPRISAMRRAYRRKRGGRW